VAWQGASEFSKDEFMLPALVIQRGQFGDRFILQYTRAAPGMWMDHFLTSPDKLYDVNVVGAQRVNRAALPHMRTALRGLLVWIGSSSAAGGVPPMLGPYFAAKAGMDALAVCYARQLAPFVIETSIVVPGAFTKGTSHFVHAGSPSDTARAAEYEAGFPSAFTDAMLKALAETVPDDADSGLVADAVVAVVDAPFGKRPFRIVVDSASDGAVVSYAVIDRVRAEFLHRVGFADLMQPKDIDAT
jgi:NAD(P)-dependent dehydrogenase (short-subunit alcohol dehydrogenase family)